MRSVSAELEFAAVAGPASCRELASGRVEPPGSSWHRLSLRCQGEQIEGALDGRVVASVTDGTYARGLSGFGSGFHPARFDDLVVEGTR